MSTSPVCCRFGGASIEVDTLHHLTHMGTYNVTPTFGNIAPQWYSDPQSFRRNSCLCEGSGVFFTMRGKILDEPGWKRMKNHSQIVGGISLGRGYTEPMHDRGAIYYFLGVVKAYLSINASQFVFCYLPSWKIQCFNQVVDFNLITLIYFCRFFGGWFLLQLSLKQGIMLFGKLSFAN